MGHSIPHNSSYLDRLATFQAEAEAKPGNCTELSRDAKSNLAQPSSVVPQCFENLQFLEVVYVNAAAVVDNPFQFGFRFQGPIYDHTGVHPTLPFKHLQFESRHYCRYHADASQRLDDRR